MHAYRAFVGEGLIHLKIPFPGAWSTYTRQRQLGTPDPIAPKICGQRGLVIPSILHQKRMHALHVIAGGGVRHPENPTPMRLVYVHDPAANLNPWPDSFEILQEGGYFHTYYRARKGVRWILSYGPRGSDVPYFPKKFQFFFFKVNIFSKKLSELSIIIQY